MLPKYKPSTASIVSFTSSSTSTANGTASATATVTVTASTWRTVLLKMLICLRPAPENTRTHQKHQETHLEHEGAQNCPRAPKLARCTKTGRQVHKTGPVHQNGPGGAPSPREKTKPCENHARPRQNTPDTQQKPTGTQGNALEPRASHHNWQHKKHNGNHQEHQGTN